MNTIVSCGLYTDPNGFCESCMDNCYSAPELFVMLKTNTKYLHGVQFGKIGEVGIKM